jgi:hypothetical protein
MAAGPQRPDNYYDMKEAEEHSSRDDGEMAVAAADVRENEQTSAVEPQRPLVQVAGSWAHCMSGSTLGPYRSSGRDPSCTSLRRHRSRLLEDT